MVHQAGQDEVHVLAAALEDFDVALLFAKVHVAVVALGRAGEGGGLAVHLDEGFAGWLALGIGYG